MKFCFNELLMAASTALDCVEHELVGATNNHSRRVACLCIHMGEEAGLDGRQLSDLAGYAMLHDNALTEYMQSEFLYAKDSTGKKEIALAAHCSMGERNVKEFPFFEPVEGAILYHHENADGSGAFGKKAEETPLYARLIHLADQLDVRYDLNTITEEKYEQVRQFFRQNEGILFAEEEIGLFLRGVTYQDLQKIQHMGVEKELDFLMLHNEEEFSPDRLMSIAGLFAHIIDYKSTVTSSHSLGIARKAYEMGKYYGFEEEKCAQLYLAGALHDIGKLAVDVNILEKPGKLTEEEFEEIKRHVVMSHEILSGIKGFETIDAWASNHHEKLDGSGYPLGIGADKLGREQRLMACIDIYQALEESRSYKEKKSHGEIMEILNSMAASGGLDKSIVADIGCYFAAKASA